MTVKDWSSITLDSLSSSWNRIINAFPAVIGAIVILIIGVLIAYLLRWAVATILKAANVQRLFEQITFAQTLKKAKINNDIAIITSQFIWWVTIIFFLLPAANILGINQVGDSLNSILNYLPNIGITVVLVLLGVLIANFVSKVVKATATTVDSATGDLVAAIARYGVYIFTFLLALSQLGIPSTVWNYLVIGFTAALAIGIGLSFGLGGKDSATDLIKKLRTDFRKQD